jgi:hypothetical protein
MGRVLPRPATALAVGVLIAAMMAALAVLSSLTHQNHASAFLLVGVYLSFAAVGVTGLLVGVYGGLVLLATQVFRFHRPLGPAEHHRPGARTRSSHGVDGHCFATRVSTS